MSVRDVLAWCLLPAALFAAAAPAQQSSSGGPASAAASSKYRGTDPYTQQNPYYQHRSPSYTSADNPFAPGEIYDPNRFDVTTSTGLAKKLNAAGAGRHNARARSKVTSNDTSRASSQCGNSSARGFGSGSSGAQSSSAFQTSAFQPPPCTSNLGTSSSLNRSTQMQDQQLQQLKKLPQ